MSYPTFMIMALSAIVVGLCTYVWHTYPTKYVRFVTNTHTKTYTQVIDKVEYKISVENPTNDIEIMVSTKKIKPIDQPAVIRDILKDLDLE